MKNNITIGQLDRKINIYQNTQNKTSSGQVDDTESLYLNCWAKSEDKNSSEEEEGKLWLYAMRNYTIRYDATIATAGHKMFVRDTDGDFNITGVEQIGRRKSYLLLKAIKRE